MRACLALLCRTLLVLTAGVILTAGFAPAAQAHVKSSTGYADLRVTDDGPRLNLSLDSAFLLRVAGTGPLAVGGDELARVAALDRAEPAVEAYLSERVGLFVDQVRCEPSVRRTGITEREGRIFADFALRYACPGSTDGKYQISYQVFSETDAVVDDHVLLLRYAVPGESGDAVLDGGQREVTLGEQSLAELVWRFVVIGVEHILLGLDHVLFVLALLLGARTVRDVVHVSLVFTLAHSVTLALAVLGWVNVPAWFVEPLIALSIAFVALENLIGPKFGHRLVVVFGFGLLHGLGFAGSIDLNAQLSWTLAATLISFNIGIEIGQIALIAVAFPLILFARRLSWSAIPLGLATAVVGAFGLIWFADRVPMLT